MFYIVINWRVEKSYCLFHYGLVQVMEIVPFQFELRLELKKAFSTWQTVSPVMPRSFLNLYFYLFILSLEYQKLYADV